MKSCELNKYLNINEDFQYSTNIEYDLGNESKLKNFILTESSLEVIEDIMLSVHPSSTDRARILIGAYGKGKSHLMLVILSLLMYKDTDMFDNLLNQIGQYNENLYSYIKAYLNSNRKLLPIIIQGGSNSLNQAFLSAMKRTLDMFGFQDLIPDTHFQSAITVISNWKNNFQDTYKSLINELNEPISEFIHRLENFDFDAYDNFEKIYPKLTSGSEFNPFMGFNVVEIYEDVAKKLKNKGYEGIYVIYDEFSKFLEADITKINSIDIRLLQDFAEKCNRSKDVQMHILLISHKDISNYIDKLPKNKIDGWRGVSERFSRIELKSNYYQTYQIVSTVIGQNDSYFAGFFEKYNSQFKVLYDVYSKGMLFSELDEQNLKNVIYKCYPMHPVSTFILPRLSEKVAQNERTLFTFLSSKNKSTLFDFTNNSECDCPMLTPDYLYDYFENAIKNEVYTSAIYKIWSTTNNILNKLSQEKLDELGFKIVKTIALIYITNQFEKLAPTPETITDIFASAGFETLEITKTIFDLRKKQYVIYQFKSNNYLRLTDRFSSKIEIEIANCLETLRQTIDVKQVLNEFNTSHYLYPTAYNDDFEIIRYFQFSFITDSELLEVDNWDKKIGNIDAVGVIYGIILKKDENRKSVIERISNIDSNRLIFIVPNIIMDIKQDCLEYETATKLKQENLNDEILEEELDLRIEDNKTILSQFISMFIVPENRKAEYYYKGRRKKIFRKMHISALLSDICNEIYTLTPIIRNEIINKNILNKVSTKALCKVVDAVMMTELKPNLGFVGFGPEVSIMRSVLINTGILRDIDTKPRLVINGNREDEYQNVLYEINNFFVNSEKRSLSELYEILVDPKYNIGLKKGVIPIFIAITLHAIKQYIVIYRNNRELELNSQLLLNINEKPHEYTVSFERWDDSKAQYINRLEDIFSDYIIIEEKEANSFSYIIKAMQRWFASLPKYSKEMKTNYAGEKIDIDKIKFINKLKRTDLNTRKFLFEDIINIFGLVEFTPNVADIIENIKLTYDDAINDLINGLSKDITQIFSVNQHDGATLNSIMHDWYDELKNETKNHLYNNGEDKILSIIANSTNDTKTFIKRLSKGVIGLNVQDWQDTTIKEFICELRDFKTIVEQQDDSEIREVTNSYSLTFFDENGVGVSKSFEKCEYSNRAKLLYNEITEAVDSMGQSISENEKRQVLMDILESLCK